MTCGYVSEDGGICCVGSRGFCIYLVLVIVGFEVMVLLIGVCSDGSGDGRL